MAVSHIEVPFQGRLFMAVSHIEVHFRGDCSWVSVTLRFISGEIVHGCQSH